jgi:fluoroacetyl-CoA thioesterase
MRPGLEVGQQATITVEVTSDMYARFEGNLVHPAYSTVSMVYHMEWAARQIILPYLEKHEEGMGGAVSARHLAPSKAGSVISITATLTEIKGKAVMTDVEVYDRNRMIGKGEVTQYILTKKEIEDNLAQSN